MTEIPEHLLKRSQAARAKAEGAEPPADAPAPAAAVGAPPAVAAPASPAAPAPAPAPSVPAAPPPDIPVVAAYKARKKIPVWAMITLSILPVWMFMYLKALTPEEAKAVGPLGAGATTYSGVCAGCHGAGGEGGVGYPFANGEVIKTFPHIEDQLRYVYFGTAGFQTAGVEIYGNPDRDGGAHVAGARGPMPAQGGALTDVEILNVVCHERYTAAGLEEGEEFEKWCSEDSEIHAALAAGTNTLANLHESFDDVLPMNEPLPGSPPGE